jgi:hypothetical protein
MFRMLFTCIVALACAPVTGTSQVATERMPAEKVAYTNAHRITQPLPFKVGESLLYEVGFSKLIFSGAVGELRLSVAKSNDPTKPERLDISAEVDSKGFFPKLFGIKIKDRFQSTISSDDFGLLISSKLIEEGKVRREQRSVIDRESGRVTYTERDLANQQAEPRVKQAPSPSWVQDMLSTCYFVRTQRLSAGDVIRVPISDGGEVFNIEVEVAGREEIKSDAGKFKTIKLNAKIFDGRYLRRSGEMYVWMSDDARRIPVRAKIKTSGATVTVDLKQIK